jgi:hypothetical protein
VLFYHGFKRIAIGILPPHRFPLSSLFPSGYHPCVRAHKISLIIVPHPPSSDAFVGNRNGRTNRQAHDHCPAFLNPETGNRQGASTDQPQASPGGLKGTLLQHARL